MRFRKIRCKCPISLCLSPFSQTLYCLISVSWKEMHLKISASTAKARPALCTEYVEVNQWKPSCKYAWCTPVEHLRCSSPVPLILRGSRYQIWLKSQALLSLCSSGRPRPLPGIGNSVVTSSSSLEGSKCSDSRKYAVPACLYAILESGGCRQWSSILSSSHVNSSIICWNLAQMKGLEPSEEDVALHYHWNFCLANDQTKRLSSKVTLA